MANEIFDRETRLDLLVNIIPLFILAFFIVAFLVFAPFGIDPLTSSIQFGLIAIPFVLLTVLTYFAGRAVAGSENNAPVYLPGQASVRGAEPLEVPGDEDGESELDDAETAAAELDGVSSEESGAGTDADGESDLDATTAPSQESATDPDDESETDDDSDATDTPDDADHSS